VRQCVAVGLQTAKGKVDIAVVAAAIEKSLHSFIVLCVYRETVQG
jgi:hypothetical protein